MTRQIYVRTIDNMVKRVTISKSFTNKLMDITQTKKELEEAANNNLDL